VDACRVPRQSPGWFCTSHKTWPRICAD